MKGLKDFLNDIKSNENLKQKFKGLSELQEVTTLARQYGYNFSEDELTETYLDAVSGGAFIDNTSQSGQIRQQIYGDKNLQFNYGDVTVSGRDTSGKIPSKVDPLAVLNLIFGNNL